MRSFALQNGTWTAQFHTNGIENFWSLLKCGVEATYLSVEPFHIFRYLDEQVFRFNERSAMTETVSAL